jgi:hypothetical protein
MAVKFPPHGMLNRKTLPKNELFLTDAIASVRNKMNGWELIPWKTGE